MNPLWEGLNPPYCTIVADPPWRYDEGWAPFGPTSHGGDVQRRRPLPYSSMSVDEICALPVADLADEDAHLYLWTTNRYLAASYDVARAWGFKPSQMLTWCKPRMGIGPGGAFSNTTEFFLFARRGSLKPLHRQDTTWWEWARGAHSEKPAGFFEVVHAVSPGPYVELFCRQPRFGWDSWGKGFESLTEASTEVAS
jgi:N6-adenosine-specific RNA methylase IME4